ncbi:MAG: thioesterase II family protein [Burkholderiales bacterium]
MPDTRWIVPIRSSPGDRIRLYCFHYAGGSALSFRSWARAVADGIAIFGVQLPGRNGAQAARGARRLQDLLPALTEAWVRFHAHTDAIIPFAYYGHSLGALVAFELTRALREAHEPQPAALFVSGRRAPHQPLTGRALCDLADAELLQTLNHMGGMPPSVLGSKKWNALLVPTLRADLRLSDHYEYTAAPPLHLPLDAIRGEYDHDLAHEDLMAWRRETTGAFSTGVLPGRHFFDDVGVERLHTRLAAALLALASPASAPLPTASATPCAAPRTITPVSI